MKLDQFAQIRRRIGLRPLVIGAALTVANCYGAVAQENKVAAITNGPAHAQIIAVDDIVRVSFGGLPIKLPAVSQKAGTNGAITLHFKQRFDVVGRTIQDIERDIRNRYVPVYFANLNPLIRLLKSDDIFYFEGIARPCSIAGTVSEVVTPIGGFTDFSNGLNETQIQLIRADGHEQILRYNQVRKDPKLDPEILPGDRIYIIHKTKKQ